MDDVGIIALAESAIRFVDERWGRSIAWVLALAVVALPTAIIALVLLH